MGYLSLFNKKQSPRLQVASTCARELYAVNQAVKLWNLESLFVESGICIKIVQQSLKELISHVVQTPERQFYLTKLLGYDNEIIYKPGEQIK